MDATEDVEAADVILAHEPVSASNVSLSVLRKFDSNEGTMS